MAWHWDMNVIDNLDGLIAALSLKTVLKAAGGIVTASSTGLVYFPDSDGIVSTANLNQNAWFVIRLVSGHEWCFQRGGFLYYWRVKLSATAGFTGGSPSVTRVPSATDEQVFWGAGTDAAPSFSALFTTSDFIWQCGASDDPDSCGFWAVGYNSGSSPKCVIWQLPLAGVPEDPDPYLYRCVYNQNGGLCHYSTMYYSVSPLANNQKGYLAKGRPSEAFVPIPFTALWTSDGVVVPGNTNNPHNDKEDLIPMCAVRSTASGSPAGLKGIAKWAYWTCPLRSNGDTVSLSTDRERIIVGHMSLPSNGSVPTV